MNGMMTGQRLDGKKVVRKTCDNSASPLSLGSFDLGAMSSPKRFEWAKMNLDTAAALNTFPLNLGPDGAGDGIFYRWNILFKVTMKMVCANLCTEDSRL